MENTLSRSSDGRLGETQTISRRYFSLFRTARARVKTRHEHLAHLGLPRTNTKKNKKKMHTIITYLVVNSSYYNTDILT